jgi:iron complex outermembrane recepter protein
MFWRSRFATISAVLLVYCALAQSQTATVGGHIGTKSGVSLAGLSVKSIRADGTFTSVKSDANGDYRLEMVSTGDATIQVYGRGYIPQQRSVHLRDGDHAVEDFTLFQHTTSVEVTESLREYHVDETSLATGIDERQLDVPISIQVYPNQLIEDRAILEGNELFRNISGINQSTYSAMVFRGFTQREILYNGSRGNPFGSLEGDVNNSGFSTSQIRLTNIQRVEVLKGPSSALYGSADAGGLINYVTKQPKEVTDGEVQFRFGSYDQKYGSADLSHPLTNKLFSRGAVYMEDRDTFRSNTGNFNADGVLNFLYRPNEHHMFSAEAEYIHQNLRGQRLRGVPVDAAGNFLTYTRWTANEPSDRVKMYGRILQLRGDHQLPSTWKVNYIFRYLKYENSDKYHEPRGMITSAGQTMMKRQYRNYYRANGDWSFLSNINRTIKTGSVVHQILGGFEQYNQNQSYRFATSSSTIPEINLYDPVYGLADPSTYVMTPFDTYTAHTRRTGIYGQDEIILNRFWRALVSGRLDHYHDYGYADATLEYSDVALAGRAGLVFKPTENLSIYSSGANSVTRAPIYAQTPSANGPFAPETGHEIEIGVKSDLLNRRLSLTAAYFLINKRNILRTDPNAGLNGKSPNAVLAIGAARSEGFEFNAEGFLTRKLYTTFNYTYLDTRIQKDITASAVGQYLPNAPRHTAGLFTRYNFLRQTGAGFGLEAVTRRTEPYAGIHAPGYLVADVSLYQDFGSRFHAQVQVTNLANSSYAMSSLFAARAGNMPGEPRAIIVTLTANPFLHHPR